MNIFTRVLFQAVKVYTGHHSVLLLNSQQFHGHDDVILWLLVNIAGEGLVADLWNNS